MKICGKNVQRTETASVKTLERTILEGWKETQCDWATACKMKGGGTLLWTKVRVL